MPDYLRLILNRETVCPVSGARAQSAFATEEIHVSPVLAALLDAGYSVIGAEPIDTTKDEGLTEGPS